MESAVKFILFLYADDSDLSVSGKDTKIIHEKNCSYICEKQNLFYLDHTKKSTNLTFDNRCGANTIYSKRYVHYLGMDLKEAYGGKLIFENILKFFFISYFCKDVSANTKHFLACLKKVTCKCFKTLKRGLTEYYKTLNRNIMQKNNLKRL